MGKDNTEELLFKFKSSVLQEMEALLDKKLEEQREFFEKRLADELKPIRANQDTQQISLDRIDEDLGHDRENFSDWGRRLGSVEVVVDQIRKSWERHTKRLMETMQNVTEKSIESIAEEVGKEFAPMIQDTLDTFVSTKPQIEKKAPSKWRFLKFWKWFKFK